MGSGFAAGAAIACALAWIFGRLLGGVHVRVDSQNATMTVLRDEGQEFVRLRERVDSLAALLLGEEGDSPGAAADRLRSLAELAADAAAVERRGRELRKLSEALDNSTGVVQDALDRQAVSIRGAVEAAADHLLDKLLEREVWVVLQDPQTAAALARARARAEAEVRTRYEERNAGRLQAERLQRLRLEERLRGESEINLLEARTRTFNESLPLRVCWLLSACAGLLGLWVLARLLLEGIRRQLNTPPLVDETSVGPFAFLPQLRCPRRHPPPQLAPELAEALDRFFEARGPEEPCIVLAPDVRASVRTMAFAVGEAARRDLALPNAVFYGPPGTGKTLTARRLARACGLDYAIMSGGNVIGLRDRAVPELRRVLQWAARVRSRGLVLFIDEADAFLAPRGGGAHHAGGPSAAAQDPFVQAAAAFLLSRTGEASGQLLLVLATNRLEELDSAVISRMSYPIEFCTPGPAELRALLEDRFQRIGRLLSADAQEHLSADLERWAAPVFPWQALHARGFTGRDVQGLTDEFARQWRLREALGAAACAPEADGPGWLRRWMGLREGRAQHSRRGLVRAAAAA